MLIVILWGYSCLYKLYYIQASTYVCSYTVWSETPILPSCNVRTFLHIYTRCSNQICVPDASFCKGSGTRSAATKYNIVVTGYNPSRKIQDCFYCNNIQMLINQTNWQSVTLLKPEPNKRIYFTSQPISILIITKSTSNTTWSNSYL